MTIQQAIKLLTKLQEKHGNVEIIYDCEFCGKETKLNTIVAVVKLTEER